MPEASTAIPNLSELSAPELEQMRRNIIQKYAGTTNLDDMSVEDLRDLSALTSAMRKKTVGAPKSGKKNGGTKTPKKATTLDDVTNLI